MTPALTPGLARRHLRELAADLVAAAVCTSAYEPLAGPPGLAAVARELLAAVPDAGAAPVAVQAAGRSGLLVAARSSDHVVIALHTPHALPELVRHDVLVVLADLAPEAVPLPGATADVRVHGDSERLLAAALSAARAPDPALDRASGRSEPDRKLSLFARIGRLRGHGRVRFRC